MSLSDAETRQLSELCEAIVEQTISGAQADTLARWLRESADARRLYARYLGMSASLHHYAGLMQSEPVETPQATLERKETERPTRSPFFRRHIRNIALLAACLLLTLAAGLWIGWRPSGGAESGRPVITALIGELEVESNGTTRRVSGGEQLTAGDRVHVPSNSLAVLRYADASVVEIRPESSITLMAGQAIDKEPAPKDLFLETGTLFAEVQPQRKSMVIRTPNARVRMLDTRFLITATADETRVDVQRGTVQFTPGQNHQGVDVLGGHVAVATNVNANPALQITRAAPASDNLVQNPGFEAGLKNGKPEHWGGRTAALDNTVAHTGTTSLKVSGPASFTISGPATFTYIWQSIALEPSTRYRLSVWIKTDNVTSKEGVRARYAQIQPTTIIWRSAPIRGTNDWVQWTTEFQTPADYCCGRLDLTWELNDGASAWFDDVELIKLDPASDLKR